MTMSKTHDIHVPDKNDRYEEVFMTRISKLLSAGSINTLLFLTEEGKN